MYDRSKSRNLETHNPQKIIINIVTIGSITLFINVRCKNNQLELFIPIWVTYKLERNSGSVPQCNPYIGNWIATRRSIISV